MKCLSKYLILVIVLCSLSFCQELKPTELESAKLGKIKAQRQALQATIQMMEAQIAMLQGRIQISQQLQAQKNSELLSLAEQVKKDHKWQDVDYNAEQGEDGTFIQLQKLEQKK